MSLAESYEPYGFSEHSGLDGTIAVMGQDVLPRLDLASIADALRRLPADELELSLRTKLVPMVTLPGLTLFAACGEPALALARQDGLKVVATAGATDFIAATRMIHGSRLLHEATSGLARGMPMFSACRRLTGRQWVLMAALVAFALVGALLLPGHASWMAVSTVSALFFLSIIALRILALLPPVHSRRETPPLLSDEELPVYSVLVPLYRETSVLGQLLTALTRLDYPPEKLDIKLLLEENDILMQRAVAGIRLPSQFDVIVVPSGKPQTKPRALNYGLPFCRGSLLTIYDAEDIPDMQQLRIAASAFAAAPRELACLQAQLTFYNPSENWLTRQFTIEYATLFGVMLPALADHRLPLLLGGTSNHFRIDILRQIGAWDPYNVTEDADLGLRLARHGFHTDVIDSRTHEEANVRLKNWLRQRARWLKGFLATWFVHMRQPIRLWRELGPSGFWIVQAMTLGVFASALLHPLCLAGTLALYVLEPPLSSGASLFAVAFAGLNLLILLAGYGVTMWAGMRALRRSGIAGWVLPILSMPVYWLLMSVAAWYGLWQFAVAPFHWNKTEHGLSRMQRRQKEWSRKARVAHPAPNANPKRLNQMIRMSWPDSEKSVAAKAPASVTRKS